jgi:SAM-dependent methyltransferase
MRGYDETRAREYDRESELVRGNRLLHRSYLRDLLSLGPSRVEHFIELGCGTGYFSEVFFEVFPYIRGTLIDGSEPMLDRARSRLSEKSRALEVRCARLEELDWDTVAMAPVVFSGFAVHHLSHPQKWRLFGQIFRHLPPGGRFILFDSFRPDDPESDAVLELLSCMDIKRRVESEGGEAPPLEQIIERDREVKEDEGDREASLEEHLVRLREIGFRGVTSVFQDARLAGIVASKRNEPPTGGTSSAA